jgi:hypothetical protein
MKVLKIKERKDGSADMTFEISSSDELLLRSLAMKQNKKFNKGFVKEFVLSALKEQVGEL